jgi:hypothetical protein
MDVILSVNNGLQVRARLQEPLDTLVFVLLGAQVPLGFPRPKDVVEKA